ncbi:MAG: TerB family tellurite resistance protein [Chloroflexota bacterium]
MIIAAAWADHHVAPEEINSLKDLLFRLPELTGREWAMLEMYIEAPVGEAERQRLVEQLLDQLRTSSDKALARRALDELANADGMVTEQERTVVEAIRSDIEQVGVGIFGQIGKMVSGSIARRQEALREAPNREEHFEDFIKNKVYYGVRRRLELGEAALSIQDADLRLLCLAGGLMARVAHVDLEVTEDEISAIVAALQKGWQLGRDAAAFVAEVAVSEVGPNLDYYRLTREFFESTEEQERVEFLEVLFGVANSDGRVSNEETEEIRAIANGLLLTHKQFIEAKLTIPAERR